MTNVFYSFNTFLLADCAGADVTLHGATSAPVASRHVSIADLDGLDRLMTEVAELRQTHSTRCNHSSSRSHCILQFTIHGEAAR